MNPAGRLSIAMICLAAIALGAGAILGRQAMWSLAGVALAAAWLIPWLVFARPYPDVLLVLFTAAAAAGLAIGLNPVWMTAGALLALAAWDLQRFSRWIAFAGRVEGRAKLERDHLLRLLGALFLGGALALAVQQIRFALPFWLLIVLGALLAFSLNRMLKLLDR